MADASLTIPNLDGETLALLQAESQRRGVAVPDLAREILRDGVARPATVPATVKEPDPAKAKSGPPPGPPYHDLDFLVGTWTEADLAQFEEATADFRKVDPEAWK